MDERADGLRRLRDLIDEIQAWVERPKHIWKTSKLKTWGRELPCDDLGPFVRLVKEATQQAAQLGFKLAPVSIEPSEGLTWAITTTNPRSGLSCRVEIIPRRAFLSVKNGKLQSLRRYPRLPVAAESLGLWADFLTRELARELATETEATATDNATTQRRRTRGKPGYERWRQAERKLLELKDKGTLPHIQNQAAQLLAHSDHGGFTRQTVYDAIRKTQSPELRAWFNVKPKGDKAEQIELPEGAARVAELVRRTPKFKKMIRDLDDKQRDGLAAELAAMTPENWAKTADELARDPDADWLRTFANPEQVPDPSGRDD